MEETANTIRDQVTRDLIWGDCPQCSYKHLAAAYAALTTAGMVPKRLFALGAELENARAFICLLEAEAGYTGNADLAVGCLALAEGYPDVDCVGGAAQVRGARLLAMAGDYAGARKALQPPHAHALATAHVYEARRELPKGATLTGLELWMAPRLCLGEGEEEVIYTPADLLAVLRDNMKSLRDLYELRRTKEVTDAD